MAPDDGRPRRKYPSDRLKTHILVERQGGRCYLSGRRIASIWHAEFHHDPPLAMRRVNDAGTDYLPPQLDPEHLFAVHPDAHAEQTNGVQLEKGHLLRQDSDKNRIAKAKRLRDQRQDPLAEPNSRSAAPSPTGRRWPKRPFPQRPRSH